MLLYPQAFDKQININDDSDDSSHYTPSCGENAHLKTSPRLIILVVSFR